MQMFAFGRLVVQALVLVASAGAARPMTFGFLELRLPAPSGAVDAHPAPFHLVYPETLGTLRVRYFLLAPDTVAATLISGRSLAGAPLPAAERALIIGLRALTQGRSQEAHAALASAEKGRLDPRLKECLRIDAALLLYLAGMPEEAEKEWRRAVSSGSDRKPGAGRAGDGVTSEEGGGPKDGAAPREGAWRNLYSYYLTRRDFTKAHTLVEDALRNRPGSRWAQVAKGFLLRMLGSEDEWEVFLRDKSSWQDSLHGIQIAYGKFLADREQWEEAIKYYNRGLEGAPANGPAWLELANAYYEAGSMIFAEQCIHNAFTHGISDPFVFELYGRVLIGLTEVTDTGGVMSKIEYMGMRYHFPYDTAWAGRVWRRAERIVEEGMPKALHSRPLAQLLYRIYCRNGRVEAARNLRSDLWFHFMGPPQPARTPGLAMPDGYGGPRLRAAVSYVAWPWVRALRTTDFVEFF